MCWKWKGCDTKPGMGFVEEMPDWKVGKMLISISTASPSECNGKQNRGEQHPLPAFWQTHWGMSPSLVGRQRSPHSHRGMSPSPVGRRWLPNYYRRMSPSPVRSRLSHPHWGISPSPERRHRYNSPHRGMLVVTVPNEWTTVWHL